jgi:hypothetical protein
VHPFQQRVSQRYRRALDLDRIRYAVLDLAPLSPDSQLGYQAH